MNHLTIIQKFQAAMLEQGITPPDDIVADGKLHRFYIQGHKRGTLNGAYKLHTEGIRPAGFIQDYKTGLKTNWKDDGELKPVTPEERQAYAEQQSQKANQTALELRERHLKSAEKAQRIWNDANPTTKHAYLTRKGIKPHGARLYKGALVVPLFNEQKQLVNVQFISPDGTKRFLKGGQKKSCFWWLGKQSAKVLIAEGFATAASLHGVTGLQCVVAFDAGNLKDVAKIVRARRPDVTIVICADNDASGTGQKAAENAALACDGFIALPPFPDMDFNDYARAINGENYGQ